MVDVQPHRNPACKQVLLLGSERVELAKVPPSFKGLPIAFIVAGQFAMAFLGFSGLQLF